MNPFLFLNQGDISEYNKTESALPALTILTITVCTAGIRTGKYVSQRYKLVYQTPEDMFTGIIGAIQQFETAYHSRFPRATIIFGQITGLDLSVYAYIQDHNPAHQTIVNQGIQLINREITNINERNWVPTLWTAKHVHRPRGGGRTTNYYRQLSDGLHPTANLLQLWASDIVSTAYLCT